MSSPDNHPISIEEAKDLIVGPYGDECRKLLKSCCAPIYWVAQVGNSLQVIDGATITFLQTPKKLIGITAEHVFRHYKRDAEKYNLRLFISNGVVHNLSDLVIDTYPKLDLITFDIEKKLLQSFGNEINPLSTQPPLEPKERKGIMLGGYPRKERIKLGPVSESFGLVHILGVSNTVTDEQITWIPEPEYQIKNLKTGDLPPKYDFSGASGGPLLCLFETASGFAYFPLGGIITEHLVSEIYEGLEKVVAARTDIIKENGRITKLK